MRGTVTVKDVFILLNIIEIIPGAHFAAGVVDGISTAATDPDPYSQIGSLDDRYGQLTRQDYEDGSLYERRLPGATAIFDF